MKKLDFPNRITIELTNRCNVSCSFCPRQSVNMELGDMDWNLYKKIIDEASQHLPVAVVIFFRGESLLHPQFIQCIEYAKARGIGPIQFASNALALSKEKADLLLKSGIDFISFSLDTLDKDIYARSRLTGDLEKSMENVIYLCERSKVLKASGVGVPKIQVSAVDLEEYRRGQEDFVKFWKKYVDVVRIYFEHDDSGHIVSKEIREYVRKCVGEERKPCRKVFTDFLIYWNGETALCNYDWNGYIKKYNVMNHSITEIWNSSEYEEIREMHREGRFNDEIMCKGCNHWQIDYMPDGFLGKKYEGM